MSVRLLIEQGSETLVFALEDLSVAIALTNEVAPVFGVDAEQRPDAWLGANNGKIFVQRVAEAVAVKVNDVPVAKSAWLGAGDFLVIGDTRYEMAVENDDLRLKQVSPLEPTPDAVIEQLDLVPTGPIEPIKRQRVRGRKALVAAFGVLTVALVFIVVASTIQVRASPAPESINVSGGPLPAIPLLGKYVAVPGTYTVRVQKRGYKTAEESVKLSFDSESIVTLKLEELPGYLTVLSNPVKSATVHVDGKLAGQTPLHSIALTTGMHQLRVAAAGHRLLERDIQIAGKGDSQIEEVNLEPAAGIVVVYVSDPPAAELKINGKTVGRTPLRAETLIGINRIELGKDGWKPLIREVEIKSEASIRLPLFKLERAESPRGVRPNVTTAGSQEKKSIQEDRSPQSPVRTAKSAPVIPSATISRDTNAEGSLTITTTPVGANLSIDGVPRGKSPASLALPGMKDYEIIAEVPGVDRAIRKVRLEAGERKSLHIDVAGQYGIVFVNTRPAGAQLSVDGMPMGMASQRLRLTVEQHRLEVIKPGYIPYTITITPNADISKSIEIDLKRNADPSSPSS